MHPFPHRYRVEASGEGEGEEVVSAQASELAPIATAPPVQFGGPGDHWSPETLFVAAVVTCFILTFRAIAQASKLNWVHLSCDGEGTVDRVESVNRFTALSLRAHLVLRQEVDREKATRLLEKAERSCLVTNSLALRPSLTCELDVAANAGAPR